MRFKLMASSMLIASILLLSGCAINTVGSVPQNFAFNPQQNEGIAAFTIRCNVSAGDTSFQIENQNQNQKNTYQTFFSCNDYTQDLTPPELKLMKLPVGKYSIYMWDQYASFGDESTDYSSEFPPINFTVKKNKVVYLGRYFLIGGNYSRWMIKQYNSSKTDLPIIKKALPYVSSKNISVDIPSVKENE